MYPEVLKLLLAYMYCRLDAVPPRDAASLFGAAARYGLPGLRAECLSVLCATTTLEVSERRTRAHTVTCFSVLNGGSRARPGQYRCHSNCGRRLAPSVSVCSAR